MKKLLLLNLVVILTGFTSLMAQNPIPSYDFPVYRIANFQENAKMTLGRRKMNVQVQCVSFAMENCFATVYIYRLDGRIKYGPYTVYGGETLSVDIDDNEWGVLVESDDHVKVSIWIDEGGDSPVRIKSYSKKASLDPLPETRLWPFMTTPALL